MCTCNILGLFFIALQSLLYLCASLAAVLDLNGLLSPSPLQILSIQLLGVPKPPCKYCPSSAGRPQTPLQILSIICRASPNPLANTVHHLQGVPNHQKWFWTSRSVYMAVEPAYFYIMSGGVLGGQITKLDLRFSPGFCDIEYGAVEDIDWRDSERVSPLVIYFRAVICRSPQKYASVLRGAIWLAC
jgi:hypothetical protein